MVAKFRKRRLDHEQRIILMKQAAELHASGVNQRQIAIQLKVSQPTICQWLRKARQGLASTVQERVAARIRAELVDCDLYERFMNLGPAEQIKLKASEDWHPICFFGEWAARLAEQEQ